jgi:hypothetical protein
MAASGDTAVVTLKNPRSPIFVTMPFERADSKPVACAVIRCFDVKGDFVARKPSGDIEEATEWLQLLSR